jgi:hypothetical protein
VSRLGRGFGVKKIPYVLGVLCAFALVTTPCFAQPFSYDGICEASAAASLDATHFAVASDGNNDIEIYERGKPTPLTAITQNFTSYGKSDIEAAATIGNRIYWLSSHSYNKFGKDRTSRKIFFATDMSEHEGLPVLTKVGNVFGLLRDYLPAWLSGWRAQINIEGLAATPDGKLYVGLRSPLQDGDAIILPFENPEAVIEKSEKPRFGRPITLDLGRRGIRSIELLDATAPEYLIVAGPIGEAGQDFALYRWSGRLDVAPRLIDAPELKGLNPEALIVIPGTKSVQILSDDGANCDDEETPKDQRKFRSIELKF